MALPHSRGHFGLAADATLPWQGWIEVSFELSRYGNVRRLRIDASSEGTDKVVERRLQRLLGSNPFRPFIALTEGDTAPRYTLRSLHAGTATGNQPGAGAALNPSPRAAVSATVASRI